MKEAINQAHDEKRPFFLIAKCENFWFVVPYYWRERGRG